VDGLESERESSWSCGRPCDLSMQVNSFCKVFVSRRFGETLRNGADRVAGSPVCGARHTKHSPVRIQRRILDCR
jgi:hypothetical protein